MFQGGVLRGCSRGCALGMFQGLCVTIGMFQGQCFRDVSGPCYGDVLGAVLYLRDVSGGAVF
eukprot:6731813-Pyramimonas_sp.AAC.1